MQVKLLLITMVSLSWCGGASADIILNDTMTKGSRTDAPGPAGAQWFSIGPATLGTTTYNAHELKLATGTSAGQVLGYLRLPGFPVSLEAGQSMTLTFTFELAGVLGPNTAETALRFGLFNSGDARISADITTLSSSSLFALYSGYAAMLSTGTNGLSLRKRIPSTTLTNKNNLIGTPNTIYTAANASAASQSLAANTVYTGTLTVARTEAGVEFGISLSGPGLADYSLSHMDTEVSGVSTLDSFAAGWDSNIFADSNGAMVIRSLTVDAPAPGSGELIPRPCIWVRNSERSGILTKIAGQSWATTVYNALVSRAASRTTSHQTDRDAFLRGLPVVDWSAATPKFKTMPSYASSEVRTPAVALFDYGLDAAVLYYLTGDEKYARAAADILHNAIRTLLPVTPSGSTTNGGWIIQNDLLLEARVLGTQLPIIYDFLQTWLQANQVYDVQAAGLVDFNFTDAQAVFRTYYQLVRDHGSREINWSALMSTCMLNNLLALDDGAERAAALQVFVLTGSSRQASFNYDYRNYPAPDSMWPESIQYACDVVRIRTGQLVLLDRYDPSLNLLNTYLNLPLSLTRVRYLAYPNAELISFGDGRRSPDFGQEEPFLTYELVYRHAQALGRTDLTSILGPRINDGVSRGKYSRSKLDSYEALGMHNEVLHLLWSADTVAEAGTPLELPRTDAVPHAGITLQRVPAPANNALYGLMGFVGGGGHVHSHASGMSMELYGMGQVLGAKSGRLNYTDTITNNYYRVFASNNTVIVNGASCGSDAAWAADIDINTVVNIAMEPAPRQAAVSANHSFSTSTFRDDRGTLAEATQQRTLGIVRTSATTGYYVDIFRSASSLPNEYHDYIYRNVGDSVTLAANGTALPLVSAPDRFQSDIGDSRQSPGWRYFTNTEVSAPTTDTIRAVFTATLITGITRMQMIMPGATGGREYARVSSPAIVDAPSPYSSRLAPALVIRKTGSAWNQPFAAVYEPYIGADAAASVKAVSKIEKSGVLVGLKVESVVGSRTIVQYVLCNPDATDTYVDNMAGISFAGRYAVLTDNGDGSGSLYIGAGSAVSFRGYSLSSVSGANTEACLEFTSGQQPVVTANSAVNWTYSPSKQAQTISFPAVDPFFSLEPWSPGATASSGLPVTYTVLSGPATTDGTTLTFSGLGPVFIRASQSGDDTYAAALPVEHGLEILPSFVSWQLGHFDAGELEQPSISGPQAVLTSDGLPNLLKYALGLDPRTAATTGLPVLGITAAEWMFQYVRPGSVTDLSYRVETSSNITDWTPVDAQPELTGESAGMQTWKLRAPRTTANGFFRLTVSR